MAPPRVWRPGDVLARHQERSLSHLLPPGSGLALGKGQTLAQLRAALARTRERQGESSPDVVVGDPAENAESPLRRELAAGDDAPRSPPPRGRAGRTSSPVGPGPGPGLELERAPPGEDMAASPATWLTATPAGPFATPAAGATRAAPAVPHGPSQETVFTSASPLASPQEPDAALTQEPPAALDGPLTPTAAELSQGDVVGLVADASREAASAADAHHDVAIAPASRPASLEGLERGVTFRAPALGAVEGAVLDVAELSYSLDSEGEKYRVLSTLGGEASSTALLVRCDSRASDGASDEACALVSELASVAREQRGHLGLALAGCGSDCAAGGRRGELDVCKVARSAPRGRGAPGLALGALWEDGSGADTVDLGDPGPGLDAGGPLAEALPSAGARAKVWFDPSLREKEAATTFDPLLFMRLGPEALTADFKGPGRSNAERPAAAPPQDSEALREMHRHTDLLVRAHLEGRHRDRASLRGLHARAWACTVEQWRCLGCRAASRDPAEALSEYEEPKPAPLFLGEKLEEACKFEETWSSEALRRQRSPSGGEVEAFVALQLAGAPAAPEAAPEAAPRVTQAAEAPPPQPPGVQDSPPPAQSAKPQTRWCFGWRCGRAKPPVGVEARSAPVKLGAG